MNLTATSPLDEWKFLVGKWKGTSKGEFGEEDVIENTAVFSLEPSDKFIMATGEARSGGKLLNKSLSIFFYDSREGKFKRKTFFSYGFINNEVECSRSKNEIRFDITMEPLPKSFEGTRWRSFLRKISDDKIVTGLETAKAGEELKKYGETILVRAK